jgi:signal transduction histidine kinase
VKRLASAGLWVLLAVVAVLALSIHELAYHGERAMAATGERLEGRLAMLRDPGGQLGIDDMAARQRAGQFRPATLRDLSVGYTDDAVWLLFDLHNREPAPLARYLVVGPPRLADVQVFLETAPGEFLRTRTGQRVDVDQRVVRSRQLVVPLEAAPGARHHVYVRIRSANAILLDLRLWESQLFHYNERRVDLLNGLQFGALFLFALYAFVAAGTSREPAFFYFGVTLLSYSLYDISILQYGLEHLWPGRPDWALRAPGVFLALMVFGLGRVVAELLQTRTHARWWDRLLLGLSVVGLLCLPGMIWGDYPSWVQFVNYLSLALLSVNILVMALAFVRGVEGAGLVLGAFLLLWLTSLMRVGQIVGVIPFHLFSAYSMGWSMVIGGMLMAVTLGERVRRLRAEQEEARRRLVDVQIDARRQAEEAVRERTRELQAAKEAAEASSRAKSAFLAQLSHELRTPLHSILGYSGLMAAEAGDANGQRRLGAIRRSGRHLLALIDELLEYARGEAGRVQLDPQPMGLREFLASVAEETRELAHEHGARLETHFAESLPRAVRADGVRLRQVLINLIANACRHSGGACITLEAEAGAASRAGHRRLVLRVHDDGDGIAEADRERIFLPFEQGDGDGARHGMGLGLSISRQLAVLMGGRLTLLPAGTGSTFQVELELEEVDPPEAARLPLALSLPRRYAGPVRRLLVVDDIADNRELLCAILSAMGFATESVDSGAAALVALEEGGIDGVLTDQVMPGMDGLALLGEARRRGHGMPFLLVSAAQVLPEAAGSPGFAAVLLKPVEPGRLADELGRCLGLAWRHEHKAPIAGTSAALPAAPAPEALVRLRVAAEQGLVSDIEDWVEEVLEEESAAGLFALAVRDAVRRLDLAAIVGMVEAASLRSSGPAAASSDSVTP